MEPLEPSSLEPSIENITEGLDDDEMLPDAYRDEHDCIPSASYEWSETKQECVRLWLQEENISQITDEALHETGLIKAVEGGVYPIHSVTIELSIAHLTQTFSLNVEAADIHQAALGKAVGQHMPFNYTSELVPNLIEIELDGKPLLNDNTVDGLNKITGTLSGAESVTASDLLGLVTVTDNAEKQTNFPYYVEPIMIPANGKEVTVFYKMRTENNILSMGLPLS